MSAHGPEITVVVATFRRTPLLEELLESLAAQTIDRDRFEVVIVDDGSGDDTVAVLEKWTQDDRLHLRFASQENAGPATARNRAVEMAKAPLLAFTDDDCIVTPTWLEEYLAYMEDHSEVAGVGGLLRRKHDNLVARYVDNAVRMEHCQRGGRTVILITANACYRRAVFAEAGGFDTRIPWAGGEDPDLSRKVIEKGGTLMVLDGALVKHTHRDSVEGIYKDGKLIGMSRQLRMELGLFQDKVLLRSIIGMYVRHCRRGFKSEAPFFEKFVYLSFNVIKVYGFMIGALSMKYRRNRGAEGAELKKSLGASNLKDSKHAR